MARYATTIMSDGPLAYYRLDETSGLTAFDQTFHHYDATISSSGVTLTQPGALLRGGDADTAMSLNGTTGSISLPAAVSVSGSAGMSMECWFNANALSGTIGILSQSFPGVTEKGAAILISSGTLNFEVGNGTIDREPQIAISTATWYHAVLTFDGTQVTGYLNGVSIGSIPIAGTIGTTTDPMVIGAVSSSGISDFFNGTIDEVAIYAYTLTASQVSAHYLAGTSLTAGIKYSYGNQTLHDNVNYFLLEKNFDVVSINTALYKVARIEGMKFSGAVQNERLMKVVVRVVSTVSRADLETKLDALYGGLFQQKQQQLFLHAVDTRYYIADCVGAVANLAPIKGGGYPGSSVLWADVTISFLCNSPFAQASGVSTFDSGPTTLVQSVGNTYSFPVLSFAGGGNIYSRPALRIYNQTPIPSTNNTTTTATITNNTNHSTISVAALPQAANAGDIFILGWGSAVQQAVTLSAGAAQNATTLNVVSFTANATYPSGTPCNKDYSWTNVTITQTIDAQSLVISTYPSSIISATNGDYLDIFCDPYLPLGYAVVKNGNPTNLVPFNGMFPVVEPTTTTWVITITMNNLIPRAEAIWTWNAKYLS